MDVTTDTFERDVIERSRELPVDTAVEIRTPVPAA
jgi:hypothetical protein